MKALFLFLLLYALPVSADPIWIVEPSDVLKSKERVVVLDAREKLLKLRDKNAKSIDWKEFAKTNERGGELGDLKTVEKKLRALGVRNDTPVYVFGDGPDGWGADGRIVWMLRALGHERTYWVQGGLAGLKDAGWPGKLKFSKKKGDFTASKNRSLFATTKDVQKAIKNETALVDTREPREFKGRTPYGESRGGHVPTSFPLHFKQLFDKDGRVRSKSEIADLLILDGVEPSTPVIAYCTGGVRSAMFVVVLRHYGFEAKNYDGSMWLWSSLPAESHPLRKPKTQKKK